MRYKTIIIIILVTSVCLCSCFSRTSQSDSSKPVNAEEGNTSVSVVSEEKRSVEKTPVSIEKCRTDYEKTISDIKEVTCEHLNLQNSEFAPFPIFDQVGQYTIVNPDISVEDSISAIEKWINENDLTVDLDQDLYAVTQQFKENREDGLPWPHVMPYKEELDNGNGFYIDNNICHIQMGGANIYSMSNGVITKYVKSEETAALDAFGAYSENVVAEGFVDELKDQTYELLNGPVSVGDAAEEVRKYFAKGTPYMGPEGMEIVVPYVKVFSIGDIYGFDYKVRRVYKGVPFAYGDLGFYRENGGRTVCLYVKDAYSITGNVDAYCGDTNYCIFDPLTEKSDMIPLSNAIDILDAYVGNKMKIEIRNAGLEYCVIEEDATQKQTVHPCWNLTGFNSSDGRTYAFYIDVLDGEIFYHSYVEK